MGRTTRHHAAILSITSLLFSGCGGAPAHVASAPDPDPALPLLPWQASRPGTPMVDSPLVVLAGGTVMTATGRTIEDGIVVMEGGVLRAVGARDEVTIPDGAEVIDVSGRFVTPGIIDAHSHMGVYPVPSAAAHDDGNEATAPVTAQVRASDSFWPQDPSLSRALAAGITTIQVLPGSANLIGGAGETYKLHPGRSSTEMELPGAPDTMKMACGENPKRVYGAQHQAPSTRMGNVAGYRRAFQEAIEYGRSWADWQEQHRLWAIREVRWERWQAAQMESLDAPAEEVPGAGGEGAGDDPDGESPDEHPEDPGPSPAPPPRDFGKELLLGAIEGRVHVQVHCYRADEMARMIDISRELGFRIRSFHHAVEAYKIRELIAAEDISIATWADWWGFKLEAFDAIPENLALLTEAGARGVLHSDSAMLVQRLNQEAAKAMTAGRRAGIEISEDQALRWITANAAWTLGIDDRTGTLEPGRMADVVVWSASPFSVYAHPDLVFVDGIREFDRARDGIGRASDFELGLDLEQPTAGGEQ
ncbi:MAG: amidohydrolase family protein [Myxococcota bacterium]|nr:amidohydrolase family protein [Myxococcota bacterium]